MAFPLLLSPLISAITSIASGAGSLAVGAVKTATKAVSATGKAEEDKEKLESGTQAAQAASASGGGDGTPAAEEAVAEMFGGLDLAKVKSAIDDKGPMGPEEEGPKTVYKQMIQQLQYISSTLLRMEETLRMLLSVEYERIKAIVSGQQQQIRTASLERGDTDSTEKGRGILGRGKDMLGGAYGKLKGGLSGTFGKMLGLGALILAFKKYPDEIKLALEKVLEFFKGVFDYFSADDFTWKKFKTDWVDIFYPKMKSVLMGGLDWLWGAIKGAAMEWLFGASGDKKIKQETLSKAKGVENLESMTGALTAAGLDLSASQVADPSAIGGVTSTIQLSEGKWGLSGKAAMGLGEEDRKRVDTAINKALTAMYEITQESDRRVRWKGIDTASMYNYIQSGGGILEGVSVNDVLNAVPIIDGFESTNEQLKEFRLFKSAGVTKETPEAERELIFKNLAEMSSIRQALLAGEESFKPMRGEKIVGADAMNARIEELKEDNRFLGAYTQAEIEEMTGGGSTLVDTDGTTPIQKDLKATVPGGPRDSFDIRDKSMGGKRKWDSGTSSWISINAPTTTTVMTKNEMANHLAAENLYWSQQLFLNDHLRAVNS
tara:strand:- start:50 stop:1858 length:1809 start_codon:yes stop_codon:yes gene_type:complete